MLYEENLSVASKIVHFVNSSIEIKPGIFLLTHRGANVYVLAEKTITLIDTGLRESARIVLDFINHIGRSPEEIRLIVLTHNHIDHMGGLGELRKISNAKVAAHRLDIGERDHPPAADARYKEPLAQIKSKMRTMFSVMPEDVDFVLEGGEILDCLGGLEVLHTPGHTPGSICLYSQHYKIMFTGDLIRKHRKNLLLPPKMVSFNLDDNLDSIKKVYGYTTDMLCFGHGLPLTEDIKSKISALIERG